MYQVYDANGNQVTGESVYCARCGAYIKHVFDFGGQPYGSTCIEAASGIHPDNWVMENGAYSESATRKGVADKEAKRLALAAEEKSRQDKAAAVRANNAVRYADLIATLKNASRYQGDFCHEMARSIECDPFDTQLDKILRGRSYNIVRDIWGKQTGGRSGSKAYAIAIEIFDGF